ncbi:Hypothetical predicted protein [Olea europaea subsp. europaea]|uniref:Uncharacterized protein n=1 Tax=Olea europaea subsp. europaea TaxID=158383 RepID=A0A8S0V9V3_OLEEU|nr:Hypothetical predicted protein [Olea europaea subsp. europaea]
MEGTDLGEGIEDMDFDGVVVATGGHGGAENFEAVMVERCVRKTLIWEEEEEEGRQAVAAGDDEEGIV